MSLSRVWLHVHVVNPLLSIVREQHITVHFDITPRFSRRLPGPWCGSRLFFGVGGRQRSPPSARPTVHR